MGLKKFKLDAKILCTDLSAGSPGAPEERAAFLRLNIRTGVELETTQLVRDRKGNKGSVV